jgi:predicted SprT family Zn-dependent metalloprotease
MGGLRHNYTQALSKWGKAWRTPGLAKRVRISFSTRMRKSLGRVHPESGIITLNAGLASAPRNVLLEILCHEVAHVATRLRYGTRAKPHGPEWRSLVEAAGYQPVTALKCKWLSHGRPQRHTPTARLRYQCPVCQAEYFVRRRNSRLQCSACFRAGITALLRFISGR